MKNITPSRTSHPAIQRLAHRTLLVLIAALLIGIQMLSGDPLNRLDESAPPLLVPKQTPCWSTVLKPRQHSQQHNKTQMQTVATCAKSNVGSRPAFGGEQEGVLATARVRPQFRHLIAGGSKFHPASATTGVHDLSRTCSTLE